MENQNKETKNELTQLVNGSLVSAKNGQALARYTDNLQFIDDVSDTRKEEIKKSVSVIHDTDKAIKQAYFQMLPEIAKVYHNEWYKNINGIKSMNQFLELSGIDASSTRSELINVAKTFMNEKGEYINPNCKNFTYKELKILATKPESLRNQIFEIVGDKQIKQSDFDTLIKDAIKGKVLKLTDESDNVEDSKKKATPTEMRKTISNQNDMIETLKKESNNSIDCLAQVYVFAKSQNLLDEIIKIYSEYGILNEVMQSMKDLKDTNPYDNSEN